MIGQYALHLIINSSILFWFILFAFEYNYAPVLAVDRGKQQLLYAWLGL